MYYIKTNTILIDMYSDDFKKWCNKNVSIFENDVNGYYNGIFKIEKFVLQHIVDLKMNHYARILEKCGEIVGKFLHLSKRPNHLF